MLIPRIRNITCLYELVRHLGQQERLGNLLDCRFHDRYGFPYSDSLFEDIQKLTAMGLVDEDLRYYDMNGHWSQRYGVHRLGEVQPIMWKMEGVERA